MIREVFIENLFGTEQLYFTDYYCQYIVEGILLFIEKVSPYSGETLGY